MAKLPNCEINWSKFNEWLGDVPVHIRKLVEQYPIDRLYFVESQGVYVAIFGYQADGNLAVNIHRDYNDVPQDTALIMSDVPPSQLTECDIPDKYDMMLAKADSAKGGH